jgi:hypothetical protein
MSKCRGGGAHLRSRRSVSCAKSVERCYKSERERERERADNAYIATRGEMNSPPLGRPR